uniref:Uncharacterized protein n=1 Tax=Utricularia reniformis TaxID=192314 RepID=A0A1Y0B4M1_9LAMI|nr:hypothetical protein AEK19_MT2191 [Utricularia reniformis]ART32338.1 hypothetical protein AEK19_MT2191 [Utricularia reniformis]
MFGTCLRRLGPFPGALPSTNPPQTPGSTNKGVSNRLANSSFPLSFSVTTQMSWFLIYAFHQVSA